MKLITKKLWVFVAMLCTLISASAYDFEVDGIYYNITSATNLEVGVTHKYDNKQYGYVNDSYSGSVTIPAFVNYNNRTYEVTSIEDSAFGSYRNAWNSEGSNVESVILPNSITSIKYAAFACCRNLKIFDIPNKVDLIDSYAFAYSGVENIQIPNSTTQIGNNSFWMSNIRRIIIGKNVINIGVDAFTECSNLMECFILSNVCPSGLSQDSFSGAKSGFEIIVPSREIFGFGREYLTFPQSSFSYTGQTHFIDWTNNLKAYKCEINEVGCQTDVNVGKYTKYLSATYSNGIDFSVDIPFNYTINKAPMTLSVSDVQREYGEPNPTFTCSIVGFVNGENEQTIGTSPVFECEATQLSNVGNYRILASLNAPNYEITYKYGTLTIKKAPLTVTAENAERQYGDVNPTFSRSYSGFKLDDTESTAFSSLPRFSCMATKTSNVGEYPIVVSGGISQNYEIVSYENGILNR